MAFLQANHITKRYANHVALDDVSIEVPEKGIFGLLGPNGAGKTSLIRIINQITGPDSGEILFDGKPLSPHHIEQIGYLPEERGLYKKMKVGDQALYLAQLKGMPKKVAKANIKEWFDKFDIMPWYNKRVEELSKGMAQKVQFITTVMHNPKLLILDEPFSGFDPINANLIKGEILRLRDEGTTVILSTHNMASVEEVCDHIALIHQAKKILSGPVREVRDKYRTHTYEIEFKGPLISFTNALWTGFEFIDKEVHSEQHVTATVRALGDSTVNGLLNAVMPFVEIVSLNEVVPSMNDIFIRAVEERNVELSNTNTGA